MTVKPVTETDFYGKGFDEMSHNMKMKGAPRMAFGATRSDSERIMTPIANNSYIDS